MKDAANLAIFACTCGCGRVDLMLCDESNEPISKLSLDMDATVALVDMLCDIVERHEAAAAAMGEVAGHA